MGRVVWHQELDSVFGVLLLYSALMEKPIKQESQM